MGWTVEFHEDFEPEFDALSQEVQEELLATAKLLEEFGSQLKRPHVDTLNGSKYSNMKELRFSVHGGVWRVAFAFDPKRQGILLVAGDKSGVSQKRFYTQLIKKADARYKDHLLKLQEEGYT
ncbi:type II toxin-antitoxin system RelE/ParE family toxin [Anabaenopsis sp. FSS-46]|uniref:type II toxin-antitoxin system RelE/ParE family toxin n=1 Tax=Anabaenopsis sp. FSS-46 TaxID=2971766 RepID=UPI002476E219|nr:type II toxin-antitoxin system RelE/ParE family toxin [Anabaenopsis sp. FSS-46]MDH6098151.1 type II toxin-antitoxin system RelE/ParE family toxin [Anabaenopsis sp. FSS-46]